MGCQMRYRLCFRLLLLPAPFIVFLNAETFHFSVLKASLLCFALNTHVNINSNRNSLEVMNTVLPKVIPALVALMLVEESTVQHVTGPVSIIIYQRTVLVLWTV